MTTGMRLALGSIWLCTATAFADSVLTTPLMSRQGNTVSCNVVNGGKDDIGVTIAMVDGLNGADVFPPGAPTVSAGQATALIEAGGAGPDFVFCRFTIMSGSKKGVRASICVHNGSGTFAPCGASADAR